MKKLKLKALELGAREVLTREQLKKVLGGFDDGSGSGSGSSESCGSCEIRGERVFCKSWIVSGNITCKCPDDVGICS